MITTQYVLPTASGKRTDFERKKTQESGDQQRHSATETGMLCALAHWMIERLNSLLRVELAAVAGYQQALRALKKKAVGDSEHILRLASEHQRTVTVLQGSVQARGGAPVVTPEPCESWGIAVLTVEGAPMRLGNKDFVGALLEVERRGLAEYEAALASLDADARELVELELIPRQRRHVEGLSAMLVHLAA